MKLLLDTDIGSDVDDALALGVLLAEPDAIDLVAVTCVCKIAARRAHAAASLLDLAERRDVAVFLGEDEAVLRHGRFVWREIEDRGLPEGPLAPIADEPAAQRIVRAAREEPDLEILAIGPLTNLARALALDPELPKRVRRLTVMGGHIREVRIGEHLCGPGIDYNLCSDPEASVAVLGAGFETRLVTADVTLQTWITDADLARMQAAGPLARALARLVEIWKPFMHQLFTGMGGTLAADNAAFIHDPLAALSLVDESTLHFERIRVLTTIEGGVLRTHEMPPESGLGAEMEVATAVDARAAAEAVLERLLAG